MKIEKISYRKLRVTADYENDAVEILVQLESDDEFEPVVKKLKKMCDKALALGEADRAHF